MHSTSSTTNLPKLKKTGKSKFYTHSMCGYTKITISGSQNVLKKVRYYSYRKIKHTNAHLLQNVQNGCQYHLLMSTKIEQWVCWVQQWTDKEKIKNGHKMPKWQNATPIICLLSLTNTPQLDCHEGSTWSVSIKSVYRFSPFSCFLSFQSLCEQCLMEILASSVYDHRCWQGTQASLGRAGKSN